MQPIQNYLTELLQELTIACKTVKNADECVELCHKYDLVILGENGVYNLLDTIHLPHALENRYNIKFSHEQVHSLIPVVCDFLHLNYVPLFSATDLTHSTPLCYRVTLR